MTDQNKNLKQSIETEKTDFGLQKFLLRARVIEQKQKLLGKKIEELLRKIKLRNVYQKIVSQD
mgnify:CR=1 FL=1